MTVLDHRHDRPRQEPPPETRNKAAAPVATRDGGDCIHSKPDASCQQYTTLDDPCKDSKRPPRPGYLQVGRLRRQMARLTGRKSLYQCGCRRSFGSANVVVAVADDHATAKGIMLCRNSHLCPSCARWLATQRADVLRPQLEALAGERVLVTLTLRRTLSAGLKEQNAALDGAWRATTSGAAHRRWLSQAGGLSYVRGYETGHSPRTGWGSHLHGLFVLHEPRWPTIEEIGLDINLERRNSGRRQLKGTDGALELVELSLRRLAAIQDENATPLEYLMRRFTQRFRQEVGRRGFVATARGQDWQVDQGRSLEYVSKGATAWDGLAEAIGGALKTVSKMDTVWQLAKRAEAGDIRARALVIEYAEATRGRRVLTVSRDLLLRPDEELEPGATEATGLIALTDAGLFTLRQQDDGLGLARLLDMLPSIWRDREAVVLALGEGGFGLRDVEWSWYEPSQVCGEAEP